MFSKISKNCGHGTDSVSVAIGLKTYKNLRVMPTRKVHAPLTCLEPNLFCSDVKSDVR